MLQTHFLCCRIFSRSWGYILGILLTGTGIGRAQTDAGRFKVPDVDENGVLVSMMTGESARMFHDKPMEIEGLVVEFYEADGSTVKVRIVSPLCNYDTRRNVATSDAKVDINGNGFHIQGEGYTFEPALSRMEIRSKVKVQFNNVNFKSPKSNTEPRP